MSRRIPGCLAEYPLAFISASYLDVSEHERIVKMLQMKVAWFSRNLMSGCTQVVDTMAGIKKPTMAAGLEVNNRMVGQIVITSLLTCLRMSSCINL